MTASIDLTTIEGLRSALTAPDLAGDPANVNSWVKRLAGVLEWFANADIKARSGRDFQWKLWEENGVAGLGMGSVTITAALDDDEFRLWLAKKSFEPCPSGTADSAIFLEDWYAALRERLQPFTKRTPRLKTFRVFAVMYPQVMTTVASPGALEELVARMGGDPALGRAARHAWVRGRVDEALGPVGEGYQAMARRLILPWLLYERHVSAAAPDEGLEPLPAAERYSGLTPTRGMFPAMLKTLDFMKDGATREELIDFLKVESPEAKASSLGGVINSLRSEFGVARREGKRFVLTPAGRAVLESGTPDAMADWLLMKVLGPDRLLAALRDKGPVPSDDVPALLRRLNPDWTTGVVPRSIRSWLVSMELVEIAGTTLQLTARGRQWAERITWTPQSLGPGDDKGSGGQPAPVGLQEIVEHVKRAGAFDASLVARLHSALWANPRRHFVVLSGLSGAGKTLLARSYAAAIASDEDGDRYITVPVQPGWHDPGALLGYVNPLRGDSYIRTEFLDFLLSAVRDPERPHVVVLDEMNLSHPEQYMAPLLSAMETGADIRLHSEGDTFDGVDAVVPYPSNLVIIGTLNMDETTHGLSDKVLDRAFVVEFWEIDLEAYPRWGSTGLGSAQEHHVRQLLDQLMAVLSPVRLHFGWRVVDEVVDFLRHAEAHGSVLPFEQALDDVIYAKVLPKVRGEDSPRFREALDAVIEVLTKAALHRCVHKARSLRETLLATGTTSFWR